MDNDDRDASSDHSAPTAEGIKAVIAAAAGATAIVGISGAFVGGLRIPVSGGSVAFGVGPVAAGGAVLGLAGYGIHRTS